MRSKRKIRYCRECGAEVYSNEKKCWNCGAKTTTGKISYIYLVVPLVLSLALGSLVVIGYRKGTEEGIEEGVNETTSKYEKEIADLNSSHDLELSETKDTYYEQGKKDGAKKYKKKIKSTASKEKSLVFTYYTNYLNNISNAVGFDFDDTDTFLSELEDRKGSDGTYVIYDYELISLVRENPDKYKDLLRGKEVYLISTLFATDKEVPSYDISDVYPGETLSVFIPISSFLSRFDDVVDGNVDSDLFNLDNAFYFHFKTDNRSKYLRRGTAYSDVYTILSDMDNDLAVTSLYSFTRGTDFFNSVYVLRVVLPNLASNQCLVLAEDDIKKVI